MADARRIVSPLDICPTQNIGSSPFDGGISPSSWLSSIRAVFLSLNVREFLSDWGSVDSFGTMAFGLASSLS
jgi:hypothetical protein